MNRAQMIAAMEITAAEKPVPIEINGWGKVHVRSLTVAEVEEQTDDVADKKDKSRIARGAARLLCDETGKRLFDPDNEADVKLLSAQPWKLLRQVINASDKLIEGEAPGN